MRRGLIAWSKAELPEAALAARVARTQAAMAAAGLDALAVYSNNTQPAGASWLSGFVPYWSEAMLLLPRAGQPLLIAALTKRVTFWIKGTSRLADVVSAARIGLEAGRLGVSWGGRVGVVDRECLPAGIAEDMAGAGAQLSDATELFVRVRAKSDPAEVALAAHAGAIAHEALVHLSHQDGDRAAVVGRIEGQARALGAEECYVAVAPDLARDRRFLRNEGTGPLGASFAARATVAYKGVWVRAARTIFRDPAQNPHADAAAERFAAAVAALPSGEGFAGMPSWLVEGCRTAQPLAPLIGARIAEPRVPTAGALVSVQACIEIDGAPIVLGAPALLGAAGESASILVPPIYS
jgi:hypothetical protein